MENLHYDTPYDYDTAGKPGVVVPVEINYTTGAGRGTIKMNMAQVFPCTVHDVKTIINTLWMSADPYETAGTICDYLKAAIEDLQALRIREAYSEDDKKHNAKISGYIKRYIANLDKIAQAFGLETVTDEGAQAQKMKKCVVIVGESKNGETYAAQYDGKQFEKAGRVWQVYKYCKGVYRIAVPGTGYYIAEYAGKEKDAPEQITAWILQALENARKDKPQAFEIMNDKLRTLCEAAGIDTPELPDYYKAPADPEQETATKETAEAKTRQQEPERTQAAHTFKKCPPYRIGAQVWKPCTMTAPGENGIIYGDYIHHAKSQEITVLRLSKTVRHINLYRTAEKPTTGTERSHNGILSRQAIARKAPPGNGIKYGKTAYLKICPIWEARVLQKFRGVCFQNSA